MPESQMRETELLAQVGAGIRAWRKRSGLTIGRLAEAAGIDGGFLATIETGKKAPSIVTLAKLAQALDIRLSDLFRTVPRRAETMDAQFERQFRYLAQSSSGAHRADLLVLLRQLRDPARVKAFRQLIGR
ncbi:MAG: transcriptional regulator [Elusimicrobia bacterium]|nr:MAG: transcriptional regulator [Elusimicrobiota bacterium]